MQILHTYEVYKKQLANIRNNNGWGKPIVLKQFRKQYSDFTEDEINILKSFLSDNEKKWFVAGLLDLLDSFPVELLKPMINAAVDERDPSYNNYFIRPCRRVFNYDEIQHILFDIFQHGDKRKKMGVTNALYWARRTVYIQTIYTLNEDETYQQKESKGYDLFRWEPEFEAFDYDFVEDLDVYERESPRQEAAYQKQIEILISEFFITNDLELKYHISLRLPKEIDDYPVQVRDQSKKYLLENKKQNIPTNAIELEAALKAKIN
jgi:hypothetical protein